MTASNLPCSAQESITYCASVAWIEIIEGSRMTQLKTGVNIKLSQGTYSFVLQRTCKIANFKPVSGSFYISRETYRLVRSMHGPNDVDMTAFMVKVRGTVWDKT